MEWIVEIEGWKELNVSKDWAVYLWWWLLIWYPLMLILDLFIWPKTDNYQSAKNLRTSVQCKAELLNCYLSFPSVTCFSTLHFCKLCWIFPLLWNSLWSREWELWFIPSSAGHMWRHWKDIWIHPLTWNYITISMVWEKYEGQV